jgi:hypothetical protein
MINKTVNKLKTVDTRCPWLVKDCCMYMWHVVQYTKYLITKITCHFSASFLLPQVTKICVPNAISVKVLTILNTFLADKSYIGGYQPSQADKAMFEALRGVTWPSSMSHLMRWHQHIKSFSPVELALFQTYVPTCNNLPPQIVGLLSTNNHGVDVDLKVRN